MGSGVSSDGEDVTLDEVWKQGVEDGFTDGTDCWCECRLKERLAQHHYNVEQTLAYTDGYKAGVRLPVCPVITADTEQKNDPPDQNASSIPAELFGGIARAVFAKYLFQKEITQPASVGCMWSTTHKSEFTTLKAK